MCVGGGRLSTGMTCMKLGHMSEGTLLNSSNGAPQPSNSGRLKRQVKRNTRCSGFFRVCFFHGPELGRIPSTWGIGVFFLPGFLEAANARLRSDYVGSCPFPADGTVRY